MIDIEQLIRILPDVRKPARYIGGEWNTTHKDLSSVDVSIALAYPDIYDIGMSNLGFNILYDIINDIPFALAERVYAPWTDMEEALRQNAIPLFSLESKTPLKNFDAIGFTLQHEMNYTNILTMLDLADIPLLSAERGADDPLVIAGGPCAFNPEPIADFIDAFAIGDGEELVVEVLDAIKKWKETSRSKKDSKSFLLEELAMLDGIYAPSIKISSTPVHRRFVDDLESYAPPDAPVIPYVGVVHDRYAVEIMRGCTRSCRFCQAGMIYRPVRERSGKSIKESVIKGLKATGYNDVSLVSLSSSDHSDILSITKEMSDVLRPDGISVSLPSLRMDSFSVGLASEARNSYQSSLTFAPEAGTQRLRDIINKNITDEDINATLEAAFQAGFTRIKLYYMIGLPYETYDDLDGIIEAAHRVRSMAMDMIPRKMHNRVTITVSVAAFIPKPHTPFQWIGQESLKDLDDKVDYLRKRLRMSHIKFKWHDTRMAEIEAVLARGDRSLGRGILAAWREGCRFDSWDEQLDYNKWQKAMESCGIDMDERAKKCFGLDETLPWDVIDCGVSKEFLKQEYEKASNGSKTPDCRVGPCSACGLSCKRSE